MLQRLIIVFKTDELDSAFKQKLCSYSSALFDSSLLLREAHKPALTDAIWVLLGPDVQADVPTKDSRYVLDGGGGTHSTTPVISQIYIQMHRQPVYTEYVMCKYRDAVVVFDSYDSTSTKDKAHQRQSNGNCGTTVTFTGDTPVIMNKDQFLANRQNKQRFIFSE